MPELEGDNSRVALGANYAIRAPGLRGGVDRRAGRDLAVTARTRSSALEASALDDALAAQGMRDVATIELTNLRTSSAPAAAAVIRSPAGDDALELETPDPGPGFDTVVLAVDEAGAVTWNFPLTDGNAIEPAATRGSGKTLRFRIARAPVQLPPTTSTQQRGLIGAIGKKLLKVLVYPITDLVVGAAADLFAHKWEERNRPYRVRTVTPDNFSTADVPAIQTGDTDQWKRLTVGGARALLFIHGTFSSVHSGFAGLSPDSVKTLSDNYGGRLFGFDHFTLSHSPAKNVEEFLSRVPGDVNLDVDIVCHSRGGLVARELVERQARFGLGAERLKIGKVVFVGVPNGGTALAEPDHMMHMIDRFTSVLNVFPDNFVTAILESIITAVKVIGHGGLKSLDGLAAQNPRGSYLRELAQESAGRSQYFGVTADFEPTGTPLSKLALADGVMDRIFGDRKNDLVVPTAGVFEANGSPCFPLPQDNLLQLDAARGVIHTTYFRDEDVRRHLLTWLDAT